MVVTTPTAPVPLDRLSGFTRATPLPDFPRDNRSITFREAPRFVDIFAFDNERERSAMWDPLVERQRILSGDFAISIARHENVILVTRGSSSKYETLLYTMR